MTTTLTMSLHCVLRNGHRWNIDLPSAYSAMVIRDNYRTMRKAGMSTLDARYVIVSLANGFSGSELRYA